MAAFCGKSPKAGWSVKVWDYLCGMSALFPQSAQQGGSCPSSWSALPLPLLNSSCSDQPGLRPGPSQLLQFRPPELREALCALQVCDRAVSACPAHRDLSLPVFHSPPRHPGFPQGLLGFARSRDAANSPQLSLNFRGVWRCFCQCPGSVLLLTACSPLR